MSEGMGGWQNYLLGEIAQVQTGPFGSQLHMSDYKMEGVPIITVEHLGENKILHKNLPLVGDEDRKRLIKYTLQKGDIVFSRVGSVDRRAYVSANEDGWMFSGRCLRVRANKVKVEPRFLSYYFGQESFKETIRRTAVGATMPSINTAILSEVQLSIPSFSEQKAIANVLSSLDDKIDLLHRQNKTLESMAETLFRQWFIEEAQEDWGKYSVSDFADHVKENVVPAKSKSEYYHHYSLPAFDEGKRPTLELGSEILSNKYKVVEHSILVSKLNPKVPRIWPVSSLSSKNSICSTEFQVLKPKSIKLYGYLLFLLRSNDAVDALSMAASGTSGSHQRVRPEDIFNIKTILPSLASAEQYSDMVIPGIAKTSSNLSQIETLEKLRDTLLPKLMSGEVRVAV